MLIAQRPTLTEETLSDFRSAFVIEPLEPGFARIDGETRHARLRDCLEECRQNRLGPLVIDTDPAFHRHFNRACRDHGGNTFGHKLGPLHQDRAETPRLHPVRGAADIEVDLVIAIVGGDPHSLRQFGGVRPAQLQRNRMHCWIKAQKPVTIPMDHSGRCDHLGIEQRMRRHLPVKIPTVPIRPIHNRRDGEFCVLLNIHFLIISMHYRLMLKQGGKFLHRACVSLRRVIAHINQRRQQPAACNRFKVRPNRG